MKALIRMYRCMSRSGTSLSTHALKTHFHIAWFAKSDSNNCTVVCSTNPICEASSSYHSFVDYLVDVFLLDSVIIILFQIRIV